MKDQSVFLEFLRLCNAPCLFFRSRSIVYLHCKNLQKFGLTREIRSDFLELKTDPR